MKEENNYKRYFIAREIAKELEVSPEAIRNMTLVLGVPQPKGRGGRWMISRNDRQALINLHSVTKKYKCSYEGAVKIIQKESRNYISRSALNRASKTSGQIEGLFLDWVAIKDWNKHRVKYYTADDMMGFAEFVIKSKFPESVSSTFRALSIEVARGLSRSVCVHIFGVDPENKRKKSSQLEVESSNAHFFLLREWGLSSKDTAELLSGFRDRSIISTGAAKFADGNKRTMVLEELEKRIEMMKSDGIK